MLLPLPTLLALVREYNNNNNKKTTKSKRRASKKMLERTEQFSFELVGPDEADTSKS